MRMEKGVLTPCTTRKEWDFFFFIKKQKENASSQMDFLMLKLCHTLLVTVNIYISIYLYSYMYIKKGKIIYRTVSSQTFRKK